MLEAVCIRSKKPDPPTSRDNDRSRVDVQHLTSSRKQDPSTNSNNIAVQATNRGADVVATAWTAPTLGRRVVLAKKPQRTANAKLELKMKEHSNSMKPGHAGLKSCPEEIISLPAVPTNCLEPNIMTSDHVGLQSCTAEEISFLPEVQNKEINSSLHPADGEETWQFDITGPGASDDLSLTVDDDEFKLLLQDHEESPWQFDNVKGEDTAVQDVQVKVSAEDEPDAEGFSKRKYRCVAAKGMEIN